MAGQAARIPGLFAGARGHGLLGLVWFDRRRDRSIVHQDWRIEHHRAAVPASRRADRAFRDLARADGG